MRKIRPVSRVVLKDLDSVPACTQVLVCNISHTKEIICVNGVFSILCRLEFKLRIYCEKKCWAFTGFAEGYGPSFLERKNATKFKVLWEKKKPNQEFISPSGPSQIRGCFTSCKRGIGNPAHFAECCKYRLVAIQFSNTPLSRLKKKPPSNPPKEIND